MTVDRRKRIRFKVDFSVIMTTPQGTVVGVMKNMNGEGAFVHCKEPHIPQGTFILQMELPNGSSAELSAEVVWMSTPETNQELTVSRMGVRFIWR